MQEDFVLDLEDCVANIHYEMTYFQRDLVKSLRMVAPCRRARNATIRLQRLFKEFRKLSCAAGLK